jgi:hypothetical protein
MKRTLISLAIAALGFSATVRARTHDIAFGFRMGAGFPGDVNRTGVFSIVPSLQDTTNPVLLYGNPVLINSAANSVRQFLSSDTAVTRIDGMLVRPYPVQQQSGGLSATIGAATPPVGPAVVDVLRQGFGIVKCNNFAASPSSKGSAVYVWVAASSGNHVQGGFEAASSGSTITIANARWASPPDSTGVAEIEIWPA